MTSVLTKVGQHIGIVLYTTDTPKVQAEVKGKEKRIRSIGDVGQRREVEREGK